MTYLDNLLNKSEITIEEHNKVFNNNFMQITSKINLEKYSEYRKNIYWISLEIFRTSFTWYFQSIKNDDSGTQFTIEGTAFYKSFASLSSEIACLLNNQWLFTPSLSSLLRIMLETVLFMKEYQITKTDDAVVFKAAVSSHNIHVGAPIDNERDLNFDNPGLFKAFKQNVKLNKIARKYHYGWLYKFLSGDDHIISTIEKIMPIQIDNEYNVLFFRTVQTFLFDVLMYLNEYKGLKVDYKKYQTNIDFLDFKDVN